MPFEMSRHRVYLLLRNAVALSTRKWKNLADILSPATVNASGWNCTPQMGFPLIFSMASGMLSVAHAVIRKPGAACFTAW